MTNDHLIPSKPRPAGLIRPDHDRAARALVAIEDGRLRDAEENIRAIDREAVIDCAWGLLLAGLLALRREQFAEAESLLLQAAGCSTIESEQPTGEDQVVADRLRAYALHELGRAYRRQDRLARAARVHQAAYRLRHETGSAEELAATAMELGLDADLARQYEDAQDWYHRAVDWGGKADAPSDRIQAEAWTRLVSSFTDSGHFDQATEAARNAKACWSAYDLAGVQCARADMILAGAQLKQAEFQHDTDPEAAATALPGVIEALSDAADGLLAFGVDQAPNAQWCAEQKDFAERLLASLA